MGVTKHDHNTSDNSVDSSPLSPRHETFCEAFARRPNGTAAARAAGYAASSASNQAARLLAREDILARIADLRDEAGEAQDAAVDGLVSKLAPVYDAALARDDLDTVLQAVELQARILGLVQGGATIRPRGYRHVPGAGGMDTAGLRHEEALDALA